MSTFVRRTTIDEGADQDTQDPPATQSVPPVTDQAPPTDDPTGETPTLNVVPDSDDPPPPDEWIPDTTLFNDVEGDPDAWFVREGAGEFMTETAVEFDWDEERWTGVQGRQDIYQSWAEQDDEGNWHARDGAMDYDQGEYDIEDGRWSVAGQLERLGLAEEGEGIDVARQEWEAYLEGVGADEEALSMHGFWGDNIATVHNALADGGLTGDTFTELSPLQQRILIRTYANGLDEEGDPDRDVFDLMEVMGEVEDPELRASLLAETIQAAGPGTADSEGAGAMENLTTWAAENNPELAERIAEEGAASVIADGVGPEGINELVNSTDMSTGDRLDLLAEGIERGWIDPEMESALFAQAVSDAEDMDGLTAWLESDPERADQLQECGGAAEWFVQNRGSTDAALLIGNTDLDPDVRSALFGAMAPELAQEPETPEEAALMMTAISGYVDAAMQDGDVTTALSETLSWAAQDPTSTFSQVLLMTTVTEADDPERLGAVSGDLAALLAASRNPNDPEAAADEASRIAPLLGDDRMLALMTGPAGAAGRVELFEAILSDPDFTIDTFEESFDRHWDWGAFDHRWDESEARDGLLESTFSDFAQSWADYRGGAGETVGSEGVEDYVAFTLGGGLLANSYDPNVEVSAEAQEAAQAASAEIQEFAGDGQVDIQAIPIQYANDEAGTMVLPVFQVRNSDGETCYVDNQGRRYDSLDAYAEEARLADGFVTVPEIDEDGNVVRDDDGNVQLNTHRHYDDHTIVDDAMLYGGIAGGIAMTIASGGLLGPAAAAALGTAGLAATTASSVWGIHSSIQTLQDRSDHGQTIDFTESREAAFAYLDIIGNSLGLVGNGLSLLDDTVGWVNRANQATNFLDRGTEALTNGLSVYDILDNLGEGNMSFGDAMGALGMMGVYSYGIPTATQFATNTMADIRANRRLQNIDFVELDRLRTTDPSQLSAADRRLVDLAESYGIREPRHLSMYNESIQSSGVDHTAEADLTRNIEANYEIDPVTGTIDLGDGVPRSTSDPMSTWLYLAGDDSVTQEQVTAYLQVTMQEDPTAFAVDFLDTMAANPELIETLSPEQLQAVGQSLLDVGHGFETRNNGGDPIDPNFLDALTLVGGMWIQGTTQVRPAMEANPDAAQRTREFDDYEADPSGNILLSVDADPVTLDDPIGTLQEIAGNENLDEYHAAAYVQLAIEADPLNFAVDLNTMLQDPNLPPEVRQTIAQAVTDLNAGWEERVAAGDTADADFLTGLDWANEALIDNSQAIDPLGRTGNRALSSNLEVWGEGSYLNSPDVWTDMDMPGMFWNYPGWPQSANENVNRYERRDGLIYAPDSGVRIGPDGRPSVTTQEIGAMNERSFTGPGVQIDEQGRPVVAIRDNKTDGSPTGYVVLDPVTRQPVFDANGRPEVVTDPGQTREYFSRPNINASYNRPSTLDYTPDVQEGVDPGDTDVEVSVDDPTASVPVPEVGYDDLQAVLDANEMDVPHLLTSGILDDAEIGGVLDLVRMNGGDEAARAALMNGLILEDGADGARQSAWNDYFGGETPPEPGDAAAGLVNTWDEEGQDPSTEVQSALVAMPEDPAYRDAFLGQLVEEGIGPNQMVELLAGEDGELSPLEVELLSQATAGTRFADDVALAIGSNGLRNGEVGAEDLADIERSIVAGTASTQDIAMLAFATSRGLTTDRSLDLFRMADPESGAIDLTDPDVQAMLVDPALEAIGSDGEDTGAVVLDIFSDAFAVGGPDAVADLMATMGPSLAEAGSSFTQQLAGFSDEERAAFYAMLEDTPGAATVMREAEWQSMAGSLPDVSGFLTSIGIDPASPDAARVGEMAPWFLETVPEEQRAAWLHAFEQAGVDTMAIAGNAVSIASEDGGEAFRDTWDAWHVQMMSDDASNLAGEVPLDGPDASDQALGFLLAVPADQRGDIDLGPFLEALGPDAADDPYVAHILQQYGVDTPPNS